MHKPTPSIDIAGNHQRLYTSCIKALLQKNWFDGSAFMLEVDIPPYRTVCIDDRNIRQLATARQEHGATNEELHRHLLEQGIACIAIQNSRHAYTIARPKDIYPQEYYHTVIGHLNDIYSWPENLPFIYRTQPAGLMSEALVYLGQETLSAAQASGHRFLKAVQKAL